MAGNIRKWLCSVKEKAWLVGINFKAVSIIASRQKKEPKKNLCLVF